MSRQTVHREARVQNVALGRSIFPPFSEFSPSMLFRGGVFLGLSWPNRVRGIVEAERRRTVNPRRDKFVPGPRAPYSRFRYSVIQQSIPRGHVAARFQVSIRRRSGRRVQRSPYGKSIRAILNTQMSLQPGTIYRPRYQFSVSVAPVPSRPVPENPRCLLLLQEISTGICRENVGRMRRRRRRAYILSYRKQDSGGDYWRNRVRR